MAQPKLVSPDQPFALRILLRGYEFYASLKLAVVLIFAMAFALGYATFVEAAYGTPVVQYFVYQTWWFNGLNILLGINIFCNQPPINRLPTFYQPPANHVPTTF